MAKSNRSRLIDGTTHSYVITQLALLLVEHQIPTVLDVGNTPEWQDDDGKGRDEFDAPRDARGITNFYSDDESQALFDASANGSTLYACFDQNWICDLALGLHTTPAGALNDLVERVNLWDDGEPESQAAHKPKLQKAVSEFMADSSTPVRVSYEEEQEWMSTENSMIYVCPVIVNKSDWKDLPILTPTN